MIAPAEKLGGQSGQCRWAMGDEGQNGSYSVMTRSTGLRYASEITIDSSKAVK